MKISILGSGTVGGALGAGFVRAGHDVVYGARVPGADTELAAPIVTLAEAVRHGDVIVDALPGAVALSVFQGLGQKALDGKILVDVANALTERYELVYPNGSLGAQLQDALPNTRVVKTLNTVSAQLMASPSSLAAQTTVFLSGNDADAKAIVVGLLTDLGWPSSSHVDLGDISTARGTEHYLLLFLAVMQSLGSGNFGITLIH